MCALYGMTNTAMLRTFCAGIGDIWTAGAVD